AARPTHPRRGRGRRGRPGLPRRAQRPHGRRRRADRGAVGPAAAGSWLHRRRGHPRPRSRLAAGRHGPHARRGPGRASGPVSTPVAAVVRREMRVLVLSPETTIVTVSFVLAAVLLAGLAFG